MRRLTCLTLAAMAPTAVGLVVLAPPVTAATDTGAAEAWTVPPGVTTATFSLAGASGAQSPPSQSEAGKGAQVEATGAVTPGQTYTVRVGGVGTSGGAGGYQRGRFQPGGWSKSRWWRRRGLRRLPRHDSRRVAGGGGAGGGLSFVSRGGGGVGGGGGGSTGDNRYTAGDAPGGTGLGDGNVGGGGGHGGNNDPGNNFNSNGGSAGGVSGGVENTAGQFGGKGGTGFGGEGGAPASGDLVPGWSGGGAAAAGRSSPRPVGAAC